MRGIKDQENDDKLKKKQNFDKKPEDFLSLPSQNGMLAQLVQSIALTGRGPLVRVQYIPQKPLFSGFFHFLLQC